jgi:GT2 family glycosyltransferase
MRRGYAIQPMDRPAVTVVVPTCGRAAYLEVTLDSLRNQRARTPHELLVIDDGAADSTPAVAERFGARLIRHGERRNLNVARNTGVREARADLVALLDDDVFVPPGWLDALAEGARRYPDAEAFGGPIRPRFEGNAPRGCGREDPPITALDLGTEDVEAEMVWGANFAVRRSAVERIGPFDETRGRLHGDEEDWLLRLRAAGGRIMYLADAGVDHRRDARDSTLRSLARVAFVRGRAARETDFRRGTAPGLARELRVLAGCGWHTVRRACPQGVVMGANAAGRVVETLRPR